MAKNWTEEEDATLFEFYTEEGPALCAEVLDRPKEGVIKRANRLGLAKKYIKWDKLKDSFLTSNYNEKGSEFCAKELGTTKDAVYTRAYVLKITENPHLAYKNWSAEEDTFLLNEYPYETVEYCSTYLNRSVISTVSRASYLGIKNFYNKLKTTEDYSRELKNKRSEYEVLDKYINSYTPILHRHKICGFEWECSPGHMLSFHGCPNCANKTSDNIYFIYFPALDLYKVGITKEIKARTKALGYNCSIIDSKKLSNQSSAFKLEQYILNKYSKYRVNTGSLTSGNTETLRLSIDKAEEISNLIREFK